jgi:very-short-patch-repair endonuclease
MHKINRFARRLRRQQTEAERKLWARLRARQVNGSKFRRQHPIDHYIADFCCPDRRLIVELDGGQHAEQRDEDQKRTSFLELQGYSVLRFWDNEVLRNIEGVLERIAIALRNPHPDPLPGREKEN